MSFLFRSFSDMTVAAEVEAIIPTIEINSQVSKTTHTFCYCSSDQRGRYHILDNVLEGNMLIDRNLADLIFDVQRVNCTAVLELVCFTADKHWY